MGLLLSYTCKFGTEEDLDVSAGAERFLVQSNVVRVLRNILPLEEGVDVVLWSTRNEEPHLGCGRRFENELQEFDLVVKIVAFIESVDDDCDGPLKRPTVLGGRGQELAKLRRESFGQDAWLCFDDLFDKVATRRIRPGELESDGRRKERRFLSIAQPHPKEEASINLSTVTVQR